MKYFIAVFSMILASCSGATAHASCDSLDGLRWLLGDWAADGNKTSFHESWREVSPRTFEGTGFERSKADGKVRSSEVLRIVEMAGGVFYVSKVTHNDLPVAFRLSECEGGRFIFVNPAHDFPRRIEYERRELEYLHSTGELENRDQLIDSIVSGRRRYLAIEPGERRVTFLGDGAAIVRGPANVRVAAGAAPVDFQIHYLAVYVFVDGFWQLQAWQSLRLPDE